MLCLQGSSNSFSKKKNKEETCSFVFVYHYFEKFTRKKKQRTKQYGLCTITLCESLKVRLLAIISRFVKTIK